jgi:hypothetical protein
MPSAARPSGVGSSKVSFKPPGNRPSTETLPGSKNPGLPDALHFKPPGNEPLAAELSGSKNADSGLAAELSGSKNSDSGSLMITVWGAVGRLS